jgi:5'-3' exonuclease
MGITSLKTLIPECAVTKSIQQFRNKRVLVDASIYLYRFIYRSPTVSECTKFVLDGFLQQLRIFKKYDIIPVYVFDGLATANKKVLEDRKKQREKVQAKANVMKQEVFGMEKQIADLESELTTITQKSGIIDDESDNECMIGSSEEDATTTADISDADVAGNIVLDAIMKSKTDLSDQKRLLSTQMDEKRSSILSLEKQSRKPTGDQVNKTKELFTILGVPYINSPAESDAMCAYLVKNRQVDVVFSEDTDMLPLRCTSFVCGFDNERAVLTEYNIGNVLATLELTYEQFVDLCILLGCDYADKIGQIGPKKALPLIKKYNTIENIIDEYIKPNPKLVEKHRYGTEFLQQAATARDMFYTDHHIETYFKENQHLLEQFKDFRWCVPDNIRGTFSSLLKSCNITDHVVKRWTDQLTSPDEVLGQKSKIPKMDLAERKPGSQQSITEFFKKGVSSTNTNTSTDASSAPP